MWMLLSYVINFPLRHRRGIATAAAARITSSRSVVMSSGANQTGRQALVRLNRLRPRGMVRELGRAQRPDGPDGLLIVRSLSP